MTIFRRTSHGSEIAARLALSEKGTCALKIKEESVTVMYKPDVAVTSISSVKLSMLKTSEVFLA